MLHSCVVNVIRALGELVVLLENLVALLPARIL